MKLLSQRGQVPHCLGWRSARRGALDCRQSFAILAQDWTGCGVQMHEAKLYG